MQINVQYIFWDWNGTLLDDAEICMHTMNSMLQKRQMPLLHLEYYKSIFGFPVIDYYQKIGFDFKIESFEDLSVEFIEMYNNELEFAPLIEGAKEVLHHFKNTEHKNIIISAMKQDMLLKSVRDKKVEDYFSDILGISNIYADSKSKIALDFVQKNLINKNDIVLIGDTAHDYEVAEAIGCRCILIADGHQSEERLKETGAEVISTLSNLLTTIVPKSS